MTLPGMLLGNGGQVEGFGKHHAAFAIVARGWCLESPGLELEPGKSIGA